MVETFAIDSMSLETLGQRPRNRAEMRAVLQAHVPGGPLRVVCETTEDGMFVIEGATRKGRNGALSIGGIQIATGVEPSSIVVDMPEMIQMPLFPEGEADVSPGALVRVVMYEEPYGLFEVIGTVAKRRQYLTVSQWVMGTKNGLRERVREIEVIAVAAHNPVDAMRWSQPRQERGGSI